MKTKLALHVDDVFCFNPNTDRRLAFPSISNTIVSCLKFEILLL